MYDDVHFKKATGHYSPGYIYGNVKTHKPGNPIRPIISQVPTPTYAVSKQFDDIMKPYLPTEYIIKSRDEFIDIVKTIQTNGVLASLDVESLFCNVPVNKTIDIIIENVYNHALYRLLNYRPPPPY